MQQFVMPSSLAIVLGTVGAFLAVIGLTAVISPQRFAALARFGNRWVDTSQVLSKLDRRVDVDDKLLPYSRYLGMALLIALGAVWFVFQR